MESARSQTGQPYVSDNHSRNHSGRTPYASRLAKGIAPQADTEHRTAQPRGIIAIDKQGDSVLFLDPTSFSTVKTLKDFPTLPHELALTPDLTFAYIPAYGDGAHGDNPHPNHIISVVDLATRQRVADIDIHPFESPHTLRFGPDNLLYVCCENSHSVVVIDPRENRVVGAIDTGSTNTHRLTILPTHRTLWTENEEDGSLTVIDLDHRKAIASIVLPHAIAGIAVDPSETFVVAVDADAPQLFIIDVATKKLTRTITLDGHSKGSQVARFSTDGQHLLVIGDHEPLVTLFSARSDRRTDTRTLSESDAHSSARSVCLFDHDTYEQLRIEVGNKPMDAAFSLDGETLVVANEDDATLSVIDLRSRCVINTVSAGKGCETLAYF